MISEKLLKLTKRVARLTEDGLIVWKETESDDIFQISFSSSSMRIAKRQSKIDPDADEFYISVLNSEGSLVEQIGDEDLDEGDERVLIYKTFKQCYETARRQALGIDAVLDGILEDLDDL